MPQYRHFKADHLYVREFSDDDALGSVNTCLITSGYKTLLTSAVCTAYDKISPSEYHRAGIILSWKD